MGRMGRFDCKGLKDFQQQLGKLQNPDDFVESCAKELAARLLRMVVKRTPVGQYPASSGKKGGTLRRGWTGEKRASAQGYADSLTVNHFGDTYVIEIVNPVEYASYVEYGHRTAKGKPNLYRPKVKTAEYLAKMIVASTVYPDLYDKELQDSYGVMTPEELLYAMVDNAGEYQDFTMWMQKFQGFTKNLDDKVDEAKN